MNGLGTPALELAGRNIIDLHGIVKRFYIGQPNELEILHGIDLTVKEGEFVSIVGASGSGKTTLMNIIGVLDRPTEGDYILDGVDVGKAKDRELSGIRNQKIGFVFQTYNLISRTSALRNVELPMMYAGVGKKERIERAKYYLEMVGMQDRMSHRPDELSGGQKQRVSIARAMTNDPSIILADEPTGALDSKTGRKIMDIFHQLNRDQGKTIVLITHSNELAEETERIITLKDGEISEVVESDYGYHIILRLPLDPADYREDMVAGLMQERVDQWLSECPVQTGEVFEQIDLPQYRDNVQALQAAVLQELEGTQAAGEASSGSQS